MSQLSELGRTRLYTRRERRRRLTAVTLALLGAAAALWVAAALVATLSGADTTWPTLRFRPMATSSSATSEEGGGLLGLPHADPHAPLTDPPPGATSGQSQNDPQIPITLTWPAPLGWTMATALPLWLVWLRYAVRPLLAELRRPTRHRGLAPLPAIRRALGARAVRRAGRYTLPGTTWWTRLTQPATAFGYRLGQPLHHHWMWRMWLWADWEQRIRIVARTGWGKTDRLLIPIIRALPGPALVASIEPAIFEKTVTARHHRQPAQRWPWLTRLLRRWLPTTVFPVVVIDFTAPDRRYAAGYPQVRWLPIIGCVDYAIAYRRAAALITGADTASTATSTDNGQFFRDSATEVLAAWLHAADLADKDIDDLLAWLRHPDDQTTTRILRDDHRAEPSAAVNLARHLDAAAGRTTSGVLRYLSLGLNSLATREGRQLCGRRGDTQFDMEQMITNGGTVYLLADTSRIDRNKPLLSLFAAEMFLAAESVALRTRRRRLPRPYVAVVDELRYGITIPNLPYVASAQRKYGVGYVYGVQTASQEDAVYGPDAAALRAAAGITIIGGIDIDSARELSDRAGTIPVVAATHGHSQHSEQIQLHDVLTVADQQQLADGHAVILARGLAPFLAWMPSIRDKRSLDKTITSEADAVAQRVAAARERDLATARLEATTTQSGIDFTTEHLR